MKRDHGDGRISTELEVGIESHQSESTVALEHPSDWGTGIGIWECELKAKTKP